MAKQARKHGFRAENRGAHDQRRAKENRAKVRRQNKERKAEFDNAKQPVKLPTAARPHLRPDTIAVTPMRQKWSAKKQPRREVNQKRLPTEALQKLGALCIVPPSIEMIMRNRIKQLETIPPSSQPVIRDIIISSIAGVLAIVSKPEKIVTRCALLFLITPCLLYVPKRATTNADQM